MPKNDASRRSRLGRRGIVAGALAPIGAIGVLFVLVFSASAATACAPPTESQTVLITLPEIDAIAATPSVVYTQGVQNCSNIWSVSPWGTVSLYANVSVAPGECTEGSLVVAPYTNCTNSQSSGSELAVDTSVVGDWNHQGGGNCNPCHQKSAVALYDVVGGVLYRITDYGTNVTTVATFNVPYGTAENLGLAYDSVGNFSHDLIVTSSSGGQIWLVNATTGNTSLFLQLHTYIAGPAIAPTWFGSYGGDLFVAEKKHGTVVAITPTGTVSTVADWPRANAVAFPSQSQFSGRSGCGGNGGYGGCSFGSNHDVFFVANFTSGALEAFPASEFQNYSGLGFVSGGNNRGIAGFSPSGTTTLFASGTLRIGDIAFITCPPESYGGWGW